MSFTYQDIFTRGRSLLYETQGTEGANDPFFWGDAIRDTVDEIARRTLCLYLEATLDVTSATALYCVPASFYKLRSIQEQDSNGNWSELNAFTTPKANRAFGALWQNYTPSDPAQAIVIDDPNFGGVLFPTPSVSRTAALKFGGIWVPGNTWALSGTASTTVIDSNGIPNLTAVCPLPDWTIDGVVYGAASRRALQMPSPENMTRLPYIENRYQDAVGQIHAGISTYRPQAYYGFYYGGPMTVAAW